MPPKNKNESPSAADVAVKSTCVVRRTFTSHGRIVDEDTEIEHIDVHKFVTTPAEVGVQFGSTINLGNFEGARIDIWCKVPAYREEMEQAYQFAKNFADERMNEELETINQNRSNKTKENNPF